MLSFEEFHAIQERKRDKDKEQNIPTSDREGLRKRERKQSSQDYAQTKEHISSKLDSNDDNNSNENKKSAVDKDRGSLVGEFLELPEIQLILVCLIYVDIVCSVGEILLEKETPSRVESTQKMVNRTIKLLQSFTGFTAFFFSFEVLTLLGTFRLRFIKHIGYMLDLVVVGTVLYAEITGLSKVVRLLGFLRAWRVVRLAGVNTERVKQDAEAALIIVDAQKTQLQEMEAEKMRLATSLKRETESRRRVEQMLQGYKDEVETLNEALKIAALDIATAAESELEESGEESEEEIEETVYIAADGTFKHQS